MLCISRRDIYYQKKNKKQNIILSEMEKENSINARYLNYSKL